jgi:hypothetical protein
MKAAASGQLKGILKVTEDNRYYSESRSGIFRSRTQKVWENMGLDLQLADENSGVDCERNVGKK